MDKKDFFYDATLNICGHIDIEIALYESLKYLKHFIPVESMNLSVWEPDLQSLRVIARATEEEGQRLETLVTMTDDAKKYMMEMYDRFQAAKWPDADIVNDSTADPGMREIVKQFDLNQSSLMHLILETVDRPLCSVLLITPGKNVYIEEHAMILNMLKEPFSMAMSNALKHREVIKLKELLADDNKYLYSELRKISGSEIIGHKFGLKNTIEKASRAAIVDSPVLLLGETGVGKDVIANAIHYSSNRKNGPFIKVNCGAIPESLIDSELFGHEKGAFTGALAQKRGRFERAHNGTLFLDEIGELPLEVQVRLLRVLQFKEIERIGGTEPISVNIRIIAATNSNLEEMIRNKEFREDLWFRINVFPLEIPPLRNRKSDIPELIDHFINLKVKELKLGSVPKLVPGALETLINYNWPGNVRELENIIERTLILNPTGPISFDQLDFSQSALRKITHNSLDNSSDLDEVIRSHIINILAETNGKIHGKGGAADLLGINASTLRNRMNKLGIKYKRESK